MCPTVPCGSIASYPYACGNQNTGNKQVPFDGRQPSAKRPVCGRWHASTQANRQYTTMSATGSG